MCGISTDMESPGINLVGESWSGNFVGGQGKMMRVVRVARVFIFVRKMNIHIHCMS